MFVSPTGLICKWRKDVQGHYLELVGWCEAEQKWSTSWQTHGWTETPPSVQEVPAAPTWLRTSKRWAIELF